MELCIWKQAMLSTIVAVYGKDHMRLWIVKWSRSREQSSAKPSGTRCLSTRDSDPTQAIEWSHAGDPVGHSGNQVNLLSLKSLWNKNQDELVENI